MVKKIARKLTKKTEKKSILFLLLLLVVASAILAFANTLTKSPLTTNSEAAINCRNYNKKKCPVTKGCQLVRERCVANIYDHLSAIATSDCTENLIIQIMYFSNSNTAARVATGKTLNSTRILTGGTDPVNSHSHCQVKFVTCSGIAKLGSNCNIINDSAKAKLKACSQVCSDGGSHWCRIYLAKNDSTPNGCIQKKYSDLYSKIPTDYKNSSNLLNCSDPGNPEAPYGFYTFTCCQYGCEELFLLTNN